LGKAALMNGPSLTTAFVPLPGGGTALYNASGLVGYRHADWLGSSRLASTSSRGLYSSTAYAPFGEQYAASGTADPSFTGQNSDTVPSLYDFTFRRLSPSQGRWISPDPSGIAAVDPTNPQTWNRYAYVANNPLNAVDPEGLNYTPGCDRSVMICDEGGGGGGSGPPGGDPGTYGDTGYYLDYGDGGGFQVPASTAMWLLSSGNGSVYIGEDENEQPLYANFWGATGLAQTGTPTPNNGEPPPACQAKILNAANNQFGKNYTDANVNSTFNYSTGAPPGQGTLNLNIYGSTAGVSTGYYPVNWWTYAIGYGPTLHVVSGPAGNGGLDSTQTFQFGPNQATFHIDSGFPYNPIGLFFHWLLNMTKAGGYPQC
jgi:RHS repeat-associated protein